MDFRKEVDGGRAWRADNKVACGESETEGGNEVMDSGGQSLLEAGRGVVRQRSIKAGILKLSESFCFVRYACHPITARPLLAGFMMMSI